MAAEDGLEIVDAALGLARAVATEVDVSTHTGVHPRLGALDVVPFVALDPAPAPAAMAAAGSFAEAVARELGVPVFLYDGADPEGRTLPSVRRDAFVSRAPDFGPADPHPHMGAVCVGARKPLIAINCELPGDDLELAAAVARAVRERDGGLPGVRALGFPLPTKGRVQVSMNLIEPGGAPLHAVVAEVVRLAAGHGVQAERGELVGLMPAAAAAAAAGHALLVDAMSADRLLEVAVAGAFGTGAAVAGDRLRAR
jgi:glutamate formiminotransferase